MSWVFLTSAIVGDELSASRPRRFTPGTKWIEDWVGTRTGLNDVEMRKILPYRDLNSDPSVVQPVASRYTNRKQQITGKNTVSCTD
jgi:hypothetical protein